MDSVSVMIQRDFLTFEQRHDLERCVRRYVKERGIVRRAAFGQGQELF